MTKELKDLCSDYQKTHDIIYEDENQIILIGRAVLADNSSSIPTRRVLESPDLAYEILFVERIWDSLHKKDALMFLAPVYFSRDSLEMFKTGLSKTNFKG